MKKIIIYTILLLSLISCNKNDDCYTCHYYSIQTSKSHPEFKKIIRDEDVIYCSKKNVEMAMDENKTYAFTEDITTTTTVTCKKQ